MEGEVNDDMVDVIVQRRALFGQAYVQLRQAYPLLPEQLHDFQVSCTPALLCPEKKILSKIFNFRSTLLPPPYMALMETIS